jgi:phosphoenolpyruvate---glycerone phosphotransferase subunit DhaK
MKKLINRPERIVDDMIDGYITAYSDYVRRYEHHPRVIIRAKPKEHGKVGLVIGNGSGHEPIAMGWVGQGMLDANALGDVFAAPPPDLILEGIRAASHGAGVLLLISRHSGDVINGEMALELARMEGLEVEALLMYDDISSAPKGREDERRGAPGTTFIYKIVGAKAEEGASLTKLKMLGETVRDNTRTLAAAVAPGISPLTGKAMFTLPDDEIYLGMGVHGEPGLKSIKVKAAHEIVAEMMEAILQDFPFKQNDEVLVFINGMGSTTLMELLIIHRAVNTILGEHGIKAYKPLVGEYVTTQEMAGFSVSLCRCDDEMKRLWDAPVSAPFYHR